MSLHEDLKARTLALISQQMANWVVEIQRQINDRQASLVRSLDDLQETVATGPGYDRLKASLAEIDKGSSLSEVLTYLVNEVSHYVDRAAMFIVKGPSAIGWYARGVEPPEAVKQINVSLNADT